MKCIACQKEINTDETQKDANPLWYGYFIGEKCIKVICCECIKDPKKKEKYRNETF